MKTSTMLWLGLGTAAAVGLAALVTRSGSTPAPAAGATEGAALFPDLKGKADSITSILVRRAKQDTLIQKQGAGWVLPGKGGYPVPTDRVRDAVASFLDARILATKTSKPDLYPRIGVEDPDAEKAASTLVTLRGQGDAVLASVIVGKREFGDASGGSEEGAKTYVRRAGEAASLQVKGEFRAEADAMNWVDRGVCELRNERVRAVTITHPPAAQGQAPERVHISRAASQDKDFTLEGKPESRKLKDDFVLTRLGYALSSVSMDDVGPAASIDTAADAVAADYECFDGLLVHVRLVKKDGKTWATFRAQAGTPAPQPAPTPKPDDTPNGQGDEQPPAQPPAQPAAQPADPPVAQPTQPATPAAPGPEEALRKEVADLNAKWAPWVFQVPDWKATVLMPRLEDLLAAPPKEPAPEASPAAAPPADPPGPLAPR